MSVRVGDSRIKKTKSGEKLAKFSEDVAEARARVARFLDAPDGDPGPSIDDVLLELRKQNEALVLADGELRAQREELVRVQRRNEVDRRRYRDLFDLSPDALIVTDRHGKIEEANARACALLGIEGRFARGKLLVSFVGSGHRKTLSAALQSLARAPGVDCDIAIAARDGADKPITLRGGRMRDPLFIVWSARERAASDLAFGASLASDDSVRRLSREAEWLLKSTCECTKKLGEPAITAREREDALAAIDANQAMHAKLLRKVFDLYFSLIKPSEPSPPP